MIRILEAGIPPLDRKDIPFCIQCCRSQAVSKSYTAVVILYNNYSLFLQDPVYLFNAAFVRDQNERHANEQKNAKTNTIVNIGSAANPSQNKHYWNEAALDCRLQAETTADSALKSWKYKTHLMLSL